MYAKPKITGVVLETERLRLRPWRETDLADFYEYASVPGVGEAAGWPHHETVDVSREILQRFLREQQDFALELRETGKVIGSLGFHPGWADWAEEYRHLRQTEMGYVLSRDYWGRGLMTEAVRRTLRWCFEDLGLDAVSIAHFKENHRSRRVIEKCGFRCDREGVYHSDTLNRDFAEWQYILLRPFWRG